MKMSGKWRVTFFLKTYSMLLILACRITSSFSYPVVNYILIMT